MLSLEGVSLLAIDSVYLDRTVGAIEQCMRQARFANVLLLTHERRALPAGVTRVPIPRITSHQDYSQFLIWDLPVYRPLLAAHVLIVQHDGYIVHPEAWDARFLEYDYIGAPWPGGGVGNGGFSLRSRRLLDALAEIRESLTAPHPEDYAIAVTYRPALEALGVRFAPTDLARRFSVENEPYAGSFGFHGSVTQQSGTFPIEADSPAHLVQPHDHSLQRLYDEARETSSDINEHVPTLARLARECAHVTEFGIRTGVSTRGLLFGRPKSMVSYDIHSYDTREFEAVACGARIDYRAVQADVLAIDIEETDLLFIDTYHTYGQLRQELGRHAGRVRKFLVMHDTTTYGAVGEDGGRGLWPAVEEFLAESPNWRLQEKHDNNNGLTVLVNGR